MAELFLKRRGTIRGFTLIELSIVLVIIGLIVGGVLVGQNLIAAAEVRAQITQIEKYNSATNTFRGKFNAIPGDMRSEIATQFGFTVGTGCGGNTVGSRDGNGLIDGLNAAAPMVQLVGETGLFWQDISSNAGGNLVDGTFPGSGATAISCIGAGAAVTTATTIGNYIPAAKIGHANFVYVYDYSGFNWYGLSAVTSSLNWGGMTSNAVISVSQAFGIDRKTDDGLPTSGNTQASYIATTSDLTSPASAPNTTTSGGTSSSCYDTTTGTYSITVNNGNGGTCALSFKFQ